MKTTPIAIRINKPCHEDWDAMTPNEQGRFCGSCQKNVTDFSKMTDNEIIQFLSEHTGSMCGQLRESQLNRMIVHTKLAGTNWKLNSFVTALMVAGGAGMLSAQTTPPQNNQTVIIDEKHPTGPVCIKVPKTEKHILSATVIDTTTGEIVPYATVMIEGCTSRTTTDENGKFTLEIPDSVTTETITLRIYSPGSRVELFTFSLMNIDNISKVEIAREEIMMKGEMIIETPPRKCGNDKGQ